MASTLKVDQIETPSGLGNVSFGNPISGDGSQLTGVGLNVGGGTVVAGDFLYHDGTEWTRLPKGTASQYLRMNAGATAPEWIATSGAGIQVPASSAAGDILYYDGTNYVRLAKGTAAQTLVMNSGATAPEWAAGGGAYKVVASGSLSNVTEFVYTNLTKTTTFHFEDVLGTVANHGLQFHFSTDNGSTYDTASNYGRVFTRVDAGNTTWSGNTSDLSQYILYSPCSTANSFRADCTIFNPAGTQYTKIRSQGEGIEGNNQYTASLYSVGVHKVATAVNAVKFHMGSGNFTATYVVTEFN